MRKWFIGIVVLVCLAGGVMLVVGRGAASDETDEAETSLPPVQASDLVIADARVVPVQYAALSIPAGGVVADVLVAEGDIVEADQALVQLEAGQQSAAVAQAEAVLRSAQSRLAELSAGARPEEIEAARAAVDAARAASPRPEDIAAAQAAVDSARASLQKLLDGPDDDEITIAAADLRRAEAALKMAQADYDQVSWLGGIESMPQSVALEGATLDYEAAQARYNLTVREPTEAEIAAAKAQLSLAEAELARMLPGSAAEAEVRRAQAQLDLIEAGPRAEAIAVAQADVDAAEATLAQARAALSDTELQAPFAGTVAALDARMGEQVAPGVPIVQLADFSSWQIETDDLTELSVVEIRVGDPATIIFDAIPDLEMPGTVIHIKGIGEDKHGDIVYTVLIQPDQKDDRLRWNMTAAVTIEPR